MLEFPLKLRTSYSTVGKGLKVPEKDESSQEEACRIVLSVPFGHLMTEISDELLTEASSEQQF